MRTSTDGGWRSCGSNGERAAPAGRVAGGGSDGEVDESDALGEASRTRGAGTGDGIASGTVGRSTLTPRPGRYEPYIRTATTVPAGTGTLCVSPLPRLRERIADAHSRTTEPPANSPKDHFS